MKWIKPQNTKDTMPKTYTDLLLILKTTHSDTWGDPSSGYYNRANGFTLHDGDLVSIEQVLYWAYYPKFPKGVEGRIGL